MCLGLVKAPFPCGSNKSVSSPGWIHRQQILQALGRGSDLRVDLAEPVLNGLRWAYPYRLSRILASDGDTVSIEISGPVQARWHLVSDAGSWAFHHRPGMRHVANMSLKTDQVWRLLTNNLSSIDQATIEVTGDPQVVDVLRSTRAIIGLPN